MSYSSVIQRAIVESSGSVTSQGLAFGSNVQSGKLLVVPFRCSTTETPGISDTRANSWTLAFIQDQGNDGSRIGVYWAVSNGAGADTVTLTVGTAAVLRFGVLEANNSGTPSLIGYASGTTGASAPTSYDTSALSVVSGNLLISLSGLAGAATFTKDADWTTITKVGGDRFCFEELIAPGTASTNCTFTTSSGMWASWGIIAFTDSSYALTDVDGDESVTSTQTGVVFSGTGFGASQGGSTLKLIKDAVSITLSPSAWSDSSITANILRTGGGVTLPYGPITARTTVSSVNADLALTLSPPDARSYVTLSSVHATSAYRITASGDLAIGDQLEVTGVTGGTFADVTLQSDGTFYCSASVTAFTVARWQVSDGTLSADATQTVGDPDFVPDAFSFVTQTDVTPGSTVTSNTITLSGFNQNVTAFVSNGFTMSVNGGSFTSTPTNVTGGDMVTLRCTAASVAGVSATGTLTIGPVSGTFTFTTAAADLTPDAFAFITQNDVTISTIVVSNSITVAGLGTSAPISVSGGEYSVNGAAYTSLPGSVNNGDTVLVRHSSSGQYATQTITSLIIGTALATFTSSTAQAPGSGGTDPPVIVVPIDNVATQRFIVTNSTTKHRLTKTAGEIRDVGFDWSRMIPGDSIYGSTWEIPDGLTEPYESRRSGFKTTVWLGDGDSGEYRVKNRIVTGTGRVLERSLYLMVVNDGD